MDNTAKHFMLISVVENAITTKFFDNLAEAQLQMMTEFSEAEDCDLQDCSDHTYNDDECGYDQYSAVVWDGHNHDNYSWKIVPVPSSSEENTMSYFLDSIGASPDSFDVPDGEGDRWNVRLSNGQNIVVRRCDDVWQVDTQRFFNEDHAVNYLKKLIAEKLTGKRIKFRQSRIPEICGVNGAACRNPGKCNFMLRMDCPIADAFFAEKDGVEIMYATQTVNKED